MMKYALHSRNLLHSPPFRFPTRKPLGVFLVMVFSSFVLFLFPISYSLEEREGGGGGENQNQIEKSP